MTNYNERLDEILGKLHNSVVDFAETGAGNPFEDAEFAKDEILAWHNKQVGAELEALLEEIKHEDLRTISQVITARIDKLKEEVK